MTFTVELQSMRLGIKLKFFLLGWLVLALSAAHSQVGVQIPSSQKFNGEPITLNAWLFWAPALNQDHRSQAAVVLLHGCAGALDAKGKLSHRMTDYAQRFNEQGWHALVLDSLTPRGVKQICTQPYSKRLITPLLRAQDVLDAHAWLTEQKGIDQDHIGYVGWSNGGSTVLAATNLNNAVVAASSLRPVAAAVFYPGCVEDRNLGYRPNAPMLIQVGDRDDWTHMGPCKAMVEQALEPKPEIIAYPGAYHQFDSEQDVKIRYDVGSGKGVHYGGNPGANLASKKRLIEFLKIELE